MRDARRHAPRGVRLALGLILCAGLPAAAQQAAAPAGAPPRAAEPDRTPPKDQGGAGREAPPPATFAAPPDRACGGQAARYEGPKNFGLSVTRIGRAEVQNPLRPLTPEVTQVLQVVIGAKLATAYGPELTSLRRGGAPAAIEAQLGAPIRWETSLPALPDPLPIVSEAGEVLTRLAFRGCTEAPAVKAAPAAAARKERKPARPKAEAREAGAPAADEAGRPAPGPRAPAGFRIPQGAIPEPGATR